MNLVLVTLLTLVQVFDVKSHGRLMDPPARNSMWRFGFPNPVNYNDNELFCGGWAVQWQQNKGKCGICGDAYQAKRPRPHEAGGLYAKGIISRHYSVGQEIDVEIELTTNHYGYFEFYLCPNNNFHQEATQECFDRFPLYVSGTRNVRFVIPENGKRKAIFQYRLSLPAYVTCTQCVLKWIYYTGNQWGMCSNGTEGQGCGKSETFVNCADISILTSVGGGIPPIFVVDNPFLLYYKDFSRFAPYTVYQPLVVREQVCISNSLYRIIPGMDHWCQTNCLRYPPNCPQEICHCPTTCTAVGELGGRDGADTYCMDQCIVYPQKCPLKKCSCYEEGTEVVQS